MSSITLDDIVTAAERKYGDFTITVGDTEVVLRNAINLQKDKRTALIAKQDELDAEDADQEEILAECIRLVAKTRAQAEVLIEAVAGRLPVLVEVFENYGKATSLGEASASAS